MKIKSVDVYVQSATLPKFDQLADWKCTDVFNRGTRVGPEGKISCHMTDVFQCRFSHAQGLVTSADVVALISKITESKILWSDLHVIWAD